MPPRPPGFTGRSADLGRLLPHLDPASDAAAVFPLLIFAVTGMGGIGKTALAIEAAHRACSQGWFPGGTLFVDLRGYDENPVTADQAVLALLDALGVRGPDLPTTPTGQYDAYRTALDGRQGRVLLVLDNASDSGQFLPLLPGTGRHRVLITSRDRPDSLPVRLIDLEALSPDDSAALITRALHDADERDGRAAREPDALRELATLCGHLPLSLQIAAAMLRRRRHRTIASLVSEIEKAGGPTAVLDKSTRGTDLYGRSLALSPVLDTSYRRLPPDQARLLRLLALAPGVETGTEAVAALTGLDSEGALDLLEDLAVTHLVTAVPTEGGVRWRLHDLVRAYGATMVAGNADWTEDGEAARERVLAFYHRWADAAAVRLRWLPGMPEPERFASRSEALAWLDGERAGLVAAAGWAEQERYADMAVALAECLTEYLAPRRYFDDWITVSHAARKAAQSRGDHRAEAIAWNALGFALRKTGHVTEAIEAHSRARDLFQAAGNRHNEAEAQDNLGSALGKAGRVTEAIEAHSRARDLFQAAGNRRDEAITWNNLGLTLREAGRVDEAIEAHSRARLLHQTVGDRRREALTWTNLGLSLREVGRLEEAIAACDKALEIHRESENWYGVGQAFRGLALAHESACRPADARDHWLQAADAYDRADATTEAAQARTRAQELMG